MGRCVRPLWKWLDDHFEETLLIILLIAITLLTGLQVVMRRVFSHPLSWSEELCRYCFMWSGFIGVAYCIRKQCEIRIDTFMAIVPPRLRAVFAVLSEVLCLVVYAIFFVVTAQIIQKAFASEQISPAIGIPNYCIYFGALLGFGLAVLRLVERMAMKALALFRPGKSIQSPD